MKSERISQKDVIEQALEQKHRIADLKLESLVSRMKNRLAKKIIETNKQEEERIIYETLQDRLSQPNYLDYVTSTLYDIDDQYGYFNQHHYSTGHQNGGHFLVGSYGNQYEHQVVGGQNEHEDGHHQTTHHEHHQVQSHQTTQHQQEDDDFFDDEVAYHYGAHNKQHYLEDENEDDDDEDNEDFSGNHHHYQDRETHQSRLQQERERRAKEAEEYYLQFLFKKQQEEQSEKIQRF